MKISPSLIAGLIAGALFVQPVGAAERPLPPVPVDAVEEGGGRIEKLLEGALELVGIRYRRGGGSVETGFDCSGFVGYVFRERLGLALPRTSHLISRTGEPVPHADLQPGDLVFFNTLRNAFSHVGIYLGDHRFVHAPRQGRAVRVEDMREHYWARRYNGARRVGGD